MDSRSSTTRQARSSGSPGLPVGHVGHGNGLARRSRLRRRFMLVSVAMLASLLAVLGVGFAQDAGTATVSVGMPAGVSAFAVSGTGGTAPEEAVALPRGSTSANESTNWSPANLPKWQVGSGASCAFSAPGDSNNAAGDLIYLDASDTTSTKLMISVFVTNLDVLSAFYTSWTFEMHVYQASNPNGGPWTSTTAQRINSDRGSVTFVVDISGANHHLALTLDEGTCYAVDVPSDPADLQPAFFVQASEL